MKEKIRLGKDTVDKYTWQMKFASLGLLLLTLVALGTMSAASAATGTHPAGMAPPANAAGEAACISCHATTNAQLSDGSGPVTCASCHADPFPAVTPTPTTTATPTPTPTPTPQAGPTLTLTLNTTGTTPTVTNITSAVMRNTAGVTVTTATMPDNVTAQFVLTGIYPGDYFIEVNGLAGLHVPTRIDSNASNIFQSVDNRLRNSAIGDSASHSILGDSVNPTYRIKVYPPGYATSHPIVNYVTGLNETGYGFVIVSGSINKVEIRELNTSTELSNFTASSANHPFPAVDFQEWILGDVKDSTGAYVSNHGHLDNASVNTACIGCHANLGTKPATFPPTTANGFCFRCHNGPGGPSTGFVDPTVLVAVNGTIAGTVTNVSSGLPISGATAMTGTQSDITDVNGNYSISIASGTYTVTASATGYQSNSTSVTVTSGAKVAQNFALTATPPVTSAAQRPTEIIDNMTGIPVVNESTMNILAENFMNFSAGDQYKITITRVADGVVEFNTSGTLMGLTKETIKVNWIPKGKAAYILRSEANTTADAKIVQVINQKVISPVPELSTIVLLSAGLIGLFGLARRRNN